MTTPPRTPSPGHAARSAETRRRLSDAALTLFARQGYDNTTAAQIAELAQVTERTFFLHFPTKADAAVDVLPVLDDFAALIVEQPASLDDLTVVERAVMEWHSKQGTLPELQRRLSLIHAGAATSATLRGRQLDGNQLLADVAAKALATRHHLDEPTLEMKVTSDVVMRVLHAIFSEWIGRAPEDLADVADVYFGALHRAAAVWAHGASALSTTARQSAKGTRRRVS